MPRVGNKKRLLALLVGVTLIFLVLIIRIMYIQIVQGPTLQAKALEQWTRDTTITAKRGTIYDKNMQVLAQSTSADTVVLRPNQIKEINITSTAQALALLLDMDASEITKKITDAKTNNKSEIWLKRQISSDVANKIKALKLTGVAFTIDSKRTYPNGCLLSQVIGFTSVDGLGLEGLEAKYDKYLSGTNGKLTRETDVNGRELPLSAEQYISAEDGLSLVLTVDSIMQSFLESACEDALAVNNAKGVEGIIMEVKTGKILAITNKPDYDLNDPPRNDTTKLQALSRNKVIIDSYEPGSVFKVVTLSAGLNNGTVTSASTFYDPGFKIVDGQTINCWKRPPHGAQTLAQAVQNSCNVAFMEIGLGLGTEKFYDYIYSFGFGQNTGVDFSSDGKGIVIDEKYVKNVDLARISFGQSISVTPLQMISAVNAAINNGNLMTPYLVDHMIDTNGNIVEQTEPQVVRQVISAETSAQVRTILESVVSEGGGKSAKIAGYRIGGKTGTAQKYENGVIAQGKLITSFVAFAPADNPEIIMLILVDEPKVASAFGSTVVGPIIKTVMKNCLQYMGVQPEYTAEEKASIKKNVEVPKITGLSLTDAKKQLQKSGLSYSSDGTGKVINQLPKAGELVDSDTNVIIYTENATKEATTVIVPSVIGMDALAAQTELKNHGLNISGSGTGKAKSQDPAAGSAVDEGTVVTVEFSQ